MEVEVVSRLHAVVEATTPHVLPTTIVPAAPALEGISVPSKVVVVEGKEAKSHFETRRCSEGNGFSARHSSREYGYYEQFRGYRSSPEYHYE